VKAFSGIERPARLKLDRLEAAHILHDLAALPGNRFEALKGDRKGYQEIALAQTRRGGSRVRDMSRHAFDASWRANGIMNEHTCVGGVHRCQVALTCGSPQRGS
jgi:hypothetical protein